MDKEKIITVMKLVAEDTEDDARNFDGKPFDGRTVAEYFGNHGAAIKAIAEALIQILESQRTERKWHREFNEVAKQALTRYKQMKEGE